MYKIIGKILLLLNLGLAICLGIAEILAFFIQYTGQFDYVVYLMVIFESVILIANGVLGYICQIKRKNMSICLSFAICVILSNVYFFYRAASFEFAKQFFLIFGILSTVISIFEIISILSNKEDLMR